MKTWTDKNLEKAVANASSLKQVFVTLQINWSGFQYKLMRAKIAELGLDISHFTRKGRCTKVDFAERMILDPSRFLEGHRIKKYLLDNEIVEEKCSECSTLYWNDKKLSLQIDHIDGNRYNNRIENLRLLCPNCHSLTETFGGKNAKWEKKFYRCCDCGQEICRVSIRCEDCGNKYKKHEADLNIRYTKIKWPAMSILIEMVNSSSYCAVARQLGVSDNAVRKRIKKHNVALNAMGAQLDSQSSV